MKIHRFKLKYTKSARNHEIQPGTKFSRARFLRTLEYPDGIDHEMRTSSARLAGAALVAEKLGKYGKASSISDISSANLL